MPRTKKTDGLRGILAANLRQLRRDKGLSQEALADLANLHRTYVSSVERCERNASLDTLERLANALGIDPSELLRERK
ncbi:helix-turn-helix transcriptional regulator [Accumulibacter sp.]|uniref:helix-turn-helix domain-containing protein n=1 Tax=Accumulibacter sp. TaxID=2053492 RepID=UPI0026252E12|nr:helix-turn-helix transcriptional regulator [Accumulibacter sp.]